MVFFEKYSSVVKLHSALCFAQCLSVSTNWLFIIKMENLRLRKVTCLKMSKFVFHKLKKTILIVTIVFCDWSSSFTSISAFQRIQFHGPRSVGGILVIQSYHTTSVGQIEKHAGICSYSKVTHQYS